MESRKHGTSASTPFSPLPVDLLKMINDVFQSNFDPGLKALAKLTQDKHYFDSLGRIYADEILLSVSLMREGQMSATTAYASVDFDPKASSPTVQDVLNACVDAIGAVFGQILDPQAPEKLEQLTGESLSSFEEIPFNWTPLEVERHRVHVRVDKANPRLEDLTDEWLRKNDPRLKEREEEERKQTEALFVTGDKAKKDPSSYH